MTKRLSWARRTALALMEHAAWVLPSARGSWAKAMQHELAQIENDREALTWAGGCVFAAVIMQVQRWKEIGLAGLVASAVLIPACWWAGQRTYISPGTHQVFHEDSNVGAMAGFLVFIAAALTGLYALMRWINDRNYRQAARAGWVCAAISIPYLAAVVLVSLLTPRTIVSLGDSYCWDLWCMGVQHVNSIPNGENTLFTAEVRVFSDSKHTQRVPEEAARRFLYVLDEQGRRFPLERISSFPDDEITVNPGESVKASLTFLAPANARKLYLMGAGDGGVMLPWVYVYFGSDLSLFHKRTRLRVL
jgi:hypothetical protein